ncbi:MAG TPA: bifunctional (p)ppGpp synthetase/guanosine-3',5'-bis(diphosphate) 3'-pyrophosphohydrolase [Candidatus Solibacter sp.]|jgi:guanosine-3',5'-bis(diphosphate) 3'-pyrophosphohydrolase|nr:bifunctional (p)ppGpp synthetase/guanosine-3',5'-bis(diphosphate) 3'-pyrophosphohydrolase [Candidatus Solibacter sp.]
MQFTDLVKKADYLNEKDLALLTKAYETAARAHLDQNRLSGEKYIQHPLNVADILADLRLDAETLATAILHDVVEDTNITSADLQKEFGKDIAKLVAGVTKLDKISMYSAEQVQAENIRKMLVAMAEDIRVVLVKLADRLHNMRTVEALPEARRVRMARETMDIYAPLAHRLGIWQVKWELEDLAFSQIDPQAYAEIVSLVKGKRKEREAFVAEISEILERELERVGIHAEISGRPKHVYSIWKKLDSTGKAFEDIYDLIAIRVSVDSIKDCYGVLGVIHSLWKPVPGRFKDYIAMPKSNGYQSLHTTLVSHSGEPMEIQIRTHEMHETAEVGVAAHWHYKEGGKGDSKTDEKFGWLRLLMEWQKDVLDAENFVDHVKVDIFQEEVFVFTPRGEVRSLPAGSTPIDFAYRIHTEVGHHCIGAKVNGRMASLDTRLENGDIVEILTTKSAHGPSRDWLTFAKSSSAREKIRQWFKKERRDENIVRGKELLEKELRRIQRRGLSDVSDKMLLAVAGDFQYQELDDFFAAVGYGDISTQSALLKLVAKEPPPDTPLTPLPPTPRQSLSGNVKVHGHRGLMTSLAQCCKPVPGDLIKGYITRGKGVTVHREDCVNIRHAQHADRVVEVEWDLAAREMFPVQLKIEAWDRTGLLRDIATVIADQKTNLTGVEVQVYDDKTAVISAGVEVASLTDLSRLLERIESVKDVHSVARDT